MAAAEGTVVNFKWAVDRDTWVQEHQEGSDEGYHGTGVQSKTSEFEIQFLVHILAQIGLQIIG